MTQLDMYNLLLEIFQYQFDLYRHNLVRSEKCRVFTALINKVLGCNFVSFQQGFCLSPTSKVKKPLTNEGATQMLCLAVKDIHDILTESGPNCLLDLAVIRLYEYCEMQPEHIASEVNRLSASINVDELWQHHLHTIKQKKLSIQND